MTGGQASEVVARRRELGQDAYDEVWDGVYHVVPAGKGAHGRLQFQLAAVLLEFAADGYVVTGPINLGQPDDYRVPDGAVIADGDYDDATLWFDRAALVVEVVSPDDEYLAKLGHYWRHDVREILVVDPADRAVELWARSDNCDPDPYVALSARGASTVLGGVRRENIAAHLGW